METIRNTEPDSQLDWTDQVRAVARFISDHDLPVISFEARPAPSPHHDDCYVQVHVHAPDYPAWHRELRDVIALRDENPANCPGSVFHYVIAVIAGVRVQLCHITDADTEKPAVA